MLTWIRRNRSDSSDLADIDAAEQGPKASEEPVARPLLLLVPSIGSYLTFDMHTFADADTALAFINSEISGKAGKSLRAFWTLHGPPAIVDEEHPAEVLVLTRTSDCPDVVYVVSFLDMESAYAFIRSEMGEGSPLELFLVYWTVPIIVREEPNGGVSLFPGACPQALSAATPSGLSAGLAQTISEILAGEVDQLEEPAAEVEALVELEEPAAEIEALVELEEPPAEVEALVELEEPAAEIEALVELEEPAAEIEALVKLEEPPAEIEALVKLEEPPAKTEALVKLEEPRAEIEPLVELEEPPATIEAVVELEEPLAETEALVKLEELQAEIEPLVELEEPQAETEALVKLEEPQAEIEPLVELEAQAEIEPMMESAEPPTEIAVEVQADVEDPSPALSSPDVDIAALWERVASREPGSAAGLPDDESPEDAVPDLESLSLQMRRVLRNRRRQDQPK
ncbi:MAG TPA: hypothetical protein VNL15_09025, partial [Dehalococcoidia bacterium]|nr:hypothetical protein [Dehalococcoidia bacterium]